ncbi:Hypothetical predicted protein [Mytilus galloprovincialis]|uniref:Ig-like domain-containing protein n=1 Tax=Mytilus galloprovincialis TaxID=29158 RepID=A0A8B6D3N7_MYTGA|nr:Hypothetical predicted protein [Mytilus galloprovincialis]
MNDCQNLGASVVLLFLQTSDCQDLVASVILLFLQTSDCQDLGAPVVLLFLKMRDCQDLGASVVLLFLQTSDCKYLGASVILLFLKMSDSSFRLTPGEPEISKPVEYEVGNTVILTCSSTGGNPKPSVLCLMDDIVILSGTSTSTSGNVTSTTLIVTTTTDSDLEVYECQAYNGFLQRPLVKTTYLTLNASNNPAGQRYELGDIVTLSCSSTGGNPLPTVNWLRDGKIITTGIGRSTSSGVTTSTLTFIAGLDDHLEVFECQADNDILQNPLSSTTYIELYFTPTVPILTGPNNLISASPGTWTCSSMNGYPALTISMSIQEQYYDIIAVYSYDTTDYMYTVAGTLDLILSSEKSGRSLCCNISQLFDNKEPQSVCLQLTINDKEEQNVLMYVVIGLIGGLLLFVLITGIICYRNGFTLVRGKKRENVKNDEELEGNRQEMHDYETSEAYYSTVFEDNTDLNLSGNSSERSIP